MSCILMVDKFVRMKSELNLHFGVRKVKCRIGNITTQFYHEDGTHWFNIGTGHPEFKLYDTEAEAVAELLGDLNLDIALRELRTKEMKAVRKEVEDCLNSLQDKPDPECENPNHEPNVACHHCEAKAVKVLSEINKAHRNKEV